MTGDPEAMDAERGKVSGWKVWFHPSRTAARLRHLQAEIRRLSPFEEESSALRGELEASRLENERILTTLQSAGKRIDELTALLAERGKDIAELEEKLAEHRELEAAIGAFEEKLREAEKWKAGYEKKIASLETRLHDARQKLAEEDRDAFYEVGTIDMLRPPAVDHIARTPFPELPSASSPAPRRHDPRFSNPRDPASRRPRGDGDWLAALPDEL